MNTKKKNIFKVKIGKANFVKTNIAEKKRDLFKSKWGFILASIGSAVGMGNIWRFPVLVSKYGGLTFIIPYIIFVILIGATGVVEEFALGRAAEAGPVGAFGMCTGLRGNKKIGENLGLLPIIGAMGLAIGYTCVFAWIVKYTVMSFTGELFSLGQDMDKIGGTFGATATTFGANSWIIVAILLTLLILIMGVSKGIERANKIMMPILFFLFVILFVYILRLPNAKNGFNYILTLNPEGLKNPHVWIFAFGQAFFSLSVAGNGSVIYGSYLSKKEDIPDAARNVAIFDTLAALLAAFVIIPAMATAGAELSSGGPGLMFIYLVNVMNGIKGGRIVGIIFFVAVLFAGLSSLINLYEAPVAFVQEKFKSKRQLSTVIILTIGCIVAILIQAIVSEWMDVISIYICPFGALLAAIMFFWVAGKKFSYAQVNLGAKKPIGKWFYPLGKYVYCAASLVALILGAILGGIG